MEGEGYPVHDVVGEVLKVPLPDVSMASSSSNNSSGGAASDDAETQAEDAIVMDPHKSARGYDFRASSFTMGRAHQLESLHYFAKGSAHEPGEETVLELVDNEAIVLELFLP
jgi:hypothetical protein